MPALPPLAGLGLGGGALAAALWWRTPPSACPYGRRFWVESPHPLITRRRLRDVLAPQRRERVLEVGPGTGYYSLDVAGWGLAGRRARPLRPPATDARAHHAARG